MKWLKMIAECMTESEGIHGAIMKQCTSMIHYTCNVTLNVLYMYSVIESLQIYSISMLLPSFITTSLLPQPTSYKPPQAHTPFIPHDMLHGPEFIGPLDPWDHVL